MFIKYGLKDENKGTAKVSREKENEIVFEYPCESNYDCTPYYAKIPAGQYIFEVWGAQGGQNGGLGGYAKGTISLKLNTTAFISIGGQGSSNTDNEFHPGGYNGGGTGRGHAIEYHTGGGGGATDIRLLSDTLYHRVIVAGGGGGIISGLECETYGFGGGEFGGDGCEKGRNSFSGKGGNQISPGESEEIVNQQHPGFGIGGSVTANSKNIGSGGGGGWYGGSISYFDPDINVYLDPEYQISPNSGAGGGSGYVLTKDSYKPAGYFSSEDDYFMTDIDLSGRIKQRGNGKAKITLLELFEDEKEVEEEIKESPCHNYIEQHFLMRKR
ncbi:loricrin, putative [Trichomonas vaginalis G3]|uniref:receptor protein-tyrosine kinase n=1 Tax=Trichomonas vaginalis (strain ATCC PRA-98 / G3) TaxID=412133 RepID=A2E629_TRIV3|nr:glycine-rich protein family [Trichomonas vaginalis G3]EAY11871.1 loricrin, putative [Trichomonas vaginalis G3]KAI5532281.1 glycine-rich protein family [Trichomonas vaginalis G3]|eukprot:XP_001324094.1 loricrin [Trichomonas vaginalis G3]